MWGSWVGSLRPRLANVDAHWRSLEDDMSDTAWDEYRPVVPEGTHLAVSKDNEGALRALLFSNDTNSLVGPPELVRAEREPDNEDDDKLNADQLIALALVVAGLVGATVAAPHVKSWWQERVQPALKERWTRARGSKPALVEASAPVASSELAAVASTAPDEFSKAVDAAVEDSRTSMSSVEAQQRFVAVLAAAAFIAEQMRALANARIEDDVPELTAAFGKLTSQQVTETINRLIESKTDADEVSATLMRLFNVETDDSAFVPVTNAQVRELLALPLARELRVREDPAEAEPA